MAGPAAGAAASLACLLAGLGLSAAGLGGISVQPSAFEDSLLIGLLGQLCMIEDAIGLLVQGPPSPTHKGVDFSFLFCQLCMRILLRVLICYSAADCVDQTSLSFLLLMLSCQTPRRMQANNPGFNTAQAQQCSRLCDRSHCHSTSATATPHQPEHISELPWSVRRTSASTSARQLDSLLQHAAYPSAL